MVKHPRAHLAAVVLAFIGSWIIGYWIQVTYLSTPWLVGGSVCETSVVDGSEIMACFGYPPTGVVFLAFGLMLAMSGVWHGIERLISTLPQG